MSTLELSSLTLPGAAPVARRNPTSLQLHDTTLEDAYGWMRDKSSPEVITYLEAENAYTTAAMAPTARLQEGLPAREPDLGDAQADKQLDQPQVLFNAQFGILRPNFAGAAVDAFVIAAVGDGYAQIMNHPPVAVGQPRMRNHGRRKVQRSGGHWRLLAYTFSGNDACRRGPAHWVGLKGTGLSPYINSRKIRALSRRGNAPWDQISGASPPRQAQSSRGVPLRSTTPVIPKTTIIATAIAK